MNGRFGALYPCWDKSTTEKDRLRSKGQAWIELSLTVENQISAARRAGTGVETSDAMFGKKQQVTEQIIGYEVFDRSFRCIIGPGGLARDLWPESISEKRLIRSRKLLIQPSV
ncbi:hypothetical protein PTI98_005917 [Pleurotus ostreatus]|nr:hypothetical protein PTI98_005917 [Pleurotus ostreatus]